MMHNSDAKTLRHANITSVVSESSGVTKIYIYLSLAYLENTLA